MTLRNSYDIKLFENTPGKFQLLPNLHEIEEEKPVMYFYNSDLANFYVHATERLLQEFPEDDLVTTTGSIIGRNSFEAVTAGNFYSKNDQALSEEGDLSTPSDARDLPYKTSFPPSHSFVRKTYYKFQPFYHPYVCDFIITLNTDGVSGIYKEELQNQNSTQVFNNQDYIPTPAIFQPYPVEKVDFSFSGAYSSYNWELFFHIPLLIATRLSQNQKFAEARKWFHYIFDPTSSSALADTGSERFWITKPFKKVIRDGLLNIEEILEDEDNRVDLETQLDNWANNPFNPHAVARTRMASYMRTTVMKYIDNLVAWGDHLFRRDTIESINEATQLYIFAANILGRKPPGIPPRVKAVAQSFSSIPEGQLDSFSNAKVEIESFLPHSDFNEEIPSDRQLLMPLFCIPKNDKLLSYWDTLADRLFKIRNCMNIEGEVRQLPLFEPPIDPALLVRAMTMGLDLSTILDDIHAQLPNYRFQVMLQNANQLCNDVRALGSQLLSVLEKRDAEELSLLRSGQEMKLLGKIREIKRSQVEEAKNNLQSLNASHIVVEERQSYYSSRPFMNSNEYEYYIQTRIASSIYQILQANYTLASLRHLIPATKIGSGFTLGSTYGGPNLGNAAIAALEGSKSMADLLKMRGEMSSTLGVYQRRQDDWKFQAKNAELELKQIDKQITAAEIRLAIAEKDLENHDLQIENANETDDLLRGKFTNQELYSYMIGQVSSIYFQSYQLAYEMAKKAEKCYQHELSIENTSFIQFGHWDSLKKGLLSGEKLQYDLRRLETAYLENNRREFEITRHISLATLDPIALIDLREGGSCMLDIPEVVFDLDHPGHYMRRIKSVTLTIPCMTGPYTNVSCKLTLMDNKIRKSSALNDDGSYTYQGEEDDRFIHNLGVTESIATSSAQNDSGLFVLDFRDERYLPFEGAGVISQWKIELPDEFRQFDYDTISDVIFQIRFTARDGGEALKEAATTEIRRIIEDNSEGLIRLFSTRNDFSSEWHRFLNPSGDVTTQVLGLNLTQDRFPFLVRNKTIELHTADLFLKLKEGFVYNDNPGSRLVFSLIREDGPEFPNQEFVLNGSTIPHAKPFEDTNQSIGKWRIEIDESNIANLPEEMQNDYY